MAESIDPVVLRFYTCIRSQGLRAKVIVDYTREPFVYGPGNVRVTLDHHIRTGMGWARMKRPKIPMIPRIGSRCRVWGNLTHRLDLDWYIRLDSVCGIGDCQEIQVLMGDNKTEFLELPLDEWKHVCYNISRTTVGDAIDEGR